MTNPFAELSSEIIPQSPLRAAITAAYRRPEPECVIPLLGQAVCHGRPRQDASTRWRAGSSRVCAARRAERRRGLIHEYSLSSQEGVALMCLAEALLRIPDAATARRADPRQDRRRRLGGACRTEPVAVRQRLDLGPDADRQARRDRSASRAWRPR